MSTLEDQVKDDIAKALRQTVDDLFKEEYFKYQQPDYYMKRHYGKWTIYNKEGWRVAWRLNKKQADAYMKLLEGE